MSLTRAEREILDAKLYIQTLPVWLVLDEDKLISIHYTVDDAIKRYDKILKHGARCFMIKIEQAGSTRYMFSDPYLQRQHKFRTGRLKRNKK